MKRIVRKIKLFITKLFLRLKGYIKKLLFPLYLFPIKLITYSAYYFLKFLTKLLFAFIGLIIDCVVFPFKGLKNFLKSLFITTVRLKLFILILRPEEWKTDSGF